MDPQGPLDLTPLIGKASTPSKTGYSFVFPQLEKSKSKIDKDMLSTLPLEVRGVILEMLPTESVMNLFLASPAFRRLTNDLSTSFWRSRIVLDLPWCAKTALEQIEKSTIKPPMDRLYRQIKESSQSDCWDAFEDEKEEEGIFDRNSMGLKNRRRIWLNCERTLRGIESQQMAVRQQAGIVSPVMSRVTSSRLVSISRQTLPDATLDVYFVPSPDQKGLLKDVITHFAGGEVIGIEFQLFGEECGRLFGHRGSNVERATIEPGSTIVEIILSFGPNDGDQQDANIRGLGLTFEGQMNPTHILGRLNDWDVIQVLRVNPGMEVVGVTGEFNVSQAV